MFEQQARKRPHAVAVLDDARRMTYAEINLTANRVANLLCAAGVGAEVPVGLYARPSLEALAAVMGIYKSGGVYVPLDPDYPAARIAWMLADAKPLVVLVDADLRGGLPPCSAELFSINGGEPGLAQQSTADPDVHVDLRQWAYVNYTSGSTGKPRG